MKSESSFEYISEILKNETILTEYYVLKNREKNRDCRKSSLFVINDEEKRPKRARFGIITFMQKILLI